VTVEDAITTNWIRRYRPSPSSSARLVCFPHAGGSASFFFPISKRFGSDVDVIALQYPGRQDRRHEPLIDTIGELSDRIAAELLELSAKPTVFFGHSMGAILAFETAWRLEQTVIASPRALVVSSARAPAMRRDPRRHERDDDGIVADLKLLGGTDLGLLDDELLRMTLPAIRADYRAIGNYTCPPGRTVHCAVTALTGDSDPRTTVEDAEAWRAHTAGLFRHVVLPGGHFFLIGQQDSVNAQIARELAAIR
jgi:surfactin synthase thioesterase subunit